MSRRVMRDPQELCDALEIPFSLQQLTAITAPLEPGVIIAGAGSGKTTVMAARVVWLVATGAVRPEDVLGLTFTRKAAAELAHRVKVALAKAGVIDPHGADESGEQVVMTYDAFAGRMVAEYGVRLGVDSDPVIITGATRYRLAAQVVAEAAGPFEFLSRLRPSTVIERVLQLDAELTSHLRTTRHIADHAVDWIRELDSAPVNRRGRPHAAVLKARDRAGERLELASLVDAYQDLKRHLGLVEFGDQLAIAAQLAQRVPAVSDMVRQQWPVVLLDEYQDTSAAQAELLRSLFSGATAATGRGHAVTAVGDPCQAIYGWRGAAASNISQFAEHFPRRDGSMARQFALTVNRRSGQRILDVANALAAPLREDPYTASSVTDLMAPEDTPVGEVHAATFSTWPEEIDWIADQVVAAHPDGGGQVVPRWSDIAILTRRNADIGPLYAALTAREVPVEIVGLGGLLKLPEVAVVVDTLRLLNDVTANPEVLRILSGPRWSIGLRDLALLGRRALELADTRRADDPADDPIAQAVAHVDPTDLVALLDALADPGDLPYSPEARQRFAQFVAELTDLRRHADEPLPDLVRRVIDTTGLTVELAVAELIEPHRGEHLAAFVDAVGDYLGLEPNSSLHGFLAWLDAELEHGTGLDQAVPSDRDSVKLLTVHKSKGLEWELVFVPALVDGVFPSDRVTDDWARSAAVLPADLRGDADTIPQLAEASNEALDRYHDELRQQQHRAEHRLAYVAVTRARQRLVGTGHYWRAGVQKPKTWSRYLQQLLAAARDQGRVHHEAAAPEPDQPNPLEVARPPTPWPAAPDPEWAQRRTAAAEEVAAAAHRIRTGQAEVTDLPLTLDEEALVAAWDADLDLLLQEVAHRSGPRVVPLPAAISASRLLAAQRDPERVARQLVRPMPSPPSPAADLGIRFHTWVQRYLEMPALVEPDDPTIDMGGEDSVEADFVELCRKFAEGQFSSRQPYAIEQPVTFTLDGQVVRARIDAVYAEADGGWLVVDWKTHHRERADAQQLALYRLAWAEALGVEVTQVRAGFYYVRNDHLQVFDDLPDRTELAQWIRDLASHPPNHH